MTRAFDVIVVGARCAGSPTAMLLARMGYRVLVVDRAHFPSDTVSTHLVHAPGVAALQRWGLLDQVVASGCPPITTYSFDFGPITISGGPRAAAGTAIAYCPRRTVLDQVLIDAARDAGAELREGFTVDDVLVEDGAVVGIRGRTNDGTSLVERARVVIGADGAHSRIARAVEPATYKSKPVLAVAYYSYWSGFPVDEACWALRPGQGFGAFPTNDNLTMLLAAWPRTELGNVKGDIEGNYLRALRLVFGDRLDPARREERIVGGGVANFLRTPFGPGWVLVGDAGYLKDPVTAQGITDAFQDAELCAAALDQALSGSRRFDDAMREYQHQRDARVLPIFHFTTELASLDPPAPDLAQLLGTIARDTNAMDQFASIFAGTLSPAAFFDPENVRQFAKPSS
jgi:flavin-dependent dehydrogenase